MGKASREGGMCGGGHLIGKYMNVCVEAIPFDTNVGFYFEGSYCILEKIACRIYIILECGSC